MLDRMFENTLAGIKTESLIKEVNDLEDWIKFLKMEIKKRESYDSGDRGFRLQDFEGIN